METVLKRCCVLAVLSPSPAAASGEGEFINVALLAFIGYCAIVIVPAAFRALWTLWKESRASRQAKRKTAET